MWQKIFIICFLFVYLFAIDFNICLIGIVYDNLLITIKSGTPNYVR